MKKVNIYFFKKQSTIFRNYNTFNNLNNNTVLNNYFLNKDILNNYNENNVYNLPFFKFIKPLLVNFYNFCNENNLQNNYLNTKNYSNWIKENNLFCKHYFSEIDNTLQFVNQNEILTNNNLQNEIPFWYENFIFKNCKIPTRENNLHDFYNMLIWLTFTKTKSYFNYLHLKNSNNTKNRTTLQNFITLLDECGVLIFVKNNYFNFFKENLENMKFKDLFFKNKKEIIDNCHFIIIGHSIFEMLTTKPYIGYTTKCLILNINDLQFNEIQSITINDNIKEYLNNFQKNIDFIFYEYLENNNTKLIPSNLLPLPILGIPNWWKENEKEEFYENKNYFRESKSRKN
ncbi:hypothetical protein ABK040_004711 [Willaertia magna]